MISRPQEIDLGPSFKYYAYPTPDSYSTQNALYAAKARVLMVLPQPDENVLRCARYFVDQFCKMHFDPIPPNDPRIFDVEGWLSNTNYSEKRKQQLRDIRAKMPEHITYLERRWKKNKCFIKKESYPSYKPPRGIFSRSDFAKVWLGPIAKAMESVAYEKDWFIKHVPVSDRPKFIMDRMVRPGYTYYNTDHSRFEAHMTSSVMKTFELVFYKHLLINYPREYLMLEDLIATENHCCFKDFSFDVSATRMSGDMITSLGNGITNLLATAFVMHEHHINIDDYPIFVEGDDGLFALPNSVKILGSDYTQLGFDVKLESSSSPSFGCFCGMVYSDTEPYQLVKDPVKTLMNFGWSDKIVKSNRKKQELLNAKAMSLLCELPNCPIVPFLALRVLRDCKAKKIRAKFNLDGYHTIDFKGTVRGNCLDAVVDRDAFMSTHPVNIADATRQLCSDLYGFSPTLQKSIEHRLMSCSFPYDFPEIDWILGSNKDVCDYSQNFIVSICERNVHSLPKN